MNNLKPNEQRAKTAIILIWFVLVIEIVSLFSNYFQYELLKSAANGDTITHEAAASNDLRQQIILITFIVLYFISAFTFIRWFRRAYFNLHTKTIYLYHSEGWAAGCWFTPFINLYRPYQIMKELYEVTEYILNERIENYTKKTTTSFLWIWWTLWFLSSFTRQYLYNLSRKATTIDQLNYVTIVGIVSAVIMIPLALITIKIISDYSTIESLLINIKDEPVSNIQEESI